MLIRKRNYRWNFYPTEELLSNPIHQTFAQGPQVLFIEGIIRVFFSTRFLDSQNSYISVPKFVDLNFENNQIISKSEELVIRLGKLGTYCEHGIFPLNILEVKNQILGYVSGWSRRQSVSVETAIGLAESVDHGRTFEHRGSGPILAACPQEPFLVCDPNVRFIGNRFHMWYIFGTRWSLHNGGHYERTYRIGHAESHDGISWYRLQPGHELIPTILEDEAQAMPSVVELEKDLFLMVFCYRETFDFRQGKERGYRLGWAISYNLMNWERRDDLISLEFPSWANEMQCYPNINVIGDKVVLFLNGNRFGRDGLGSCTFDRKELIDEARL